MLKYFLGVFILLFTSGAHAQDRFGRYSGVFFNSVLNQEQLAKIDFISSRSEKNEFRLMAVLSLFFGEFSNSEYVSYHFNSVRYNPLTGSLVFDQPDQDTTIVVENFQQGKFEGNLRSMTAGLIGHLSLRQGDRATSTRPLVQPLAGEYRGFCQGISMRLQIQTSRSSDDMSRVGNPFGAYIIGAQLAEDNTAVCMGSSSCVVREYSSGTYDFYKAQLNLYGTSRDLSCLVKPDGLVCGECTYRRLNKGTHDAMNLNHQVPRSDPAWKIVAEPNRDGSVNPNGGDGLQGEYIGFLHHERLGKYQRISLNLVTFQDQSGPQTQLKMSLLARLHFGGLDSKETIPYRFNERTYNLLNPQIVFERADSDTDAIVQITKIEESRIEGVWYSLIYGRVGTFVASKDPSSITLPSDTPVIDAISGQYESSHWQANVHVSLESTPINTRNPFFPLNFRGHFRMPGLTKNFAVNGGAFDFYTGKISFVLDDGTAFSGMRFDNSTILLQRPTPGTQRPMQPIKVHKFQLIER